MLGAPQRALWDGLGAVMLTDWRWAGMEAGECWAHRSGRRGAGLGAVLPGQLAGVWDAGCCCLGAPQHAWGAGLGAGLPGRLAGVRD